MNDRMIGILVGAGVAVAISVVALCISIVNYLHKKDDPTYSFCDGKIKQIDIREANRLVVCPDGSLRWIR